MSERRSGLAVFLILCASTRLSLLAHWPYQPTGPGDPDRMLADFMLPGALLAPPLPLLLVFGSSAALAGASGRLGRIAVLGLAVSGAAVALGSLAEMLSPPSPDVPRLAQLLGGAGLAILSGAVAARAAVTAMHQDA